MSPKVLSMYLRVLYPKHFYNMRSIDYDEMPTSPYLICIDKYLKNNDADYYYICDKVMYLKETHNRNGQHKYFRFRLDKI